jgi:hypothetical protein
VSIRPHEIALTAPGGAVTDGASRLRGVVRRVSFRGDSLDYQVGVADSDLVLRVVTPLARRFGVDDVVDLVIAPAACVVLGAEAVS